MVGWWGKKVDVVGVFKLEVLINFFYLNNLKWNYLFKKWFCSYKFNN